MVDVSHTDGFTKLLGNVLAGQSAPKSNNTCQVQSTNPFGGMVPHSLLLNYH